MNEEKNKTHRRSFISTFAKTGIALGLASIVNPLKAKAELLDTSKETNEAELFFKNLKGKHKLVMDVPAFHNGAVFKGTTAFLNSSNQTGTMDKDVSVVIVLRSIAMAIALPDSIWEKYKLGELYKLDDAITKTSTIKNQFYNVKSDELIELDMSLDVLQKRGVQVCVCQMAMKGNSEYIAKKYNLKKEDVEKDLFSSILPNIQIVPSGIWALNRAQENGCGYVFTG